MPSCHPLPSHVHATCHPCESRPLHSRHDGLYCFCRRHRQARKVSIHRRTPARWCCGCRCLGPCSACFTRHSGADAYVDRENLAVRWTGCVWRIYTLRYTEDSSSCANGQCGNDEEGCCQREHQLGVGLPEYLYQNGADFGDEEPEEVTSVRIGFDGIAGASFAAVEFVHHLNL